MIGFFPDIYPDELLYSQLCRYYQRTGYTKYLFAVDDLFMRRTVHPVIEWVNEYTPDAMAHITKDTDFETVIRNHTMFPTYTRFLPKTRREDALHSLLICDGNYYNLIVNQNLRRKRYLRYCPVCAKEDRIKYGETYWHREHQIIHVDVCPKHKCFLNDSSIPIGSKTTPGLFSAELEVPFDEEPDACPNEKLVEFINYVLRVFRAPVDMESDVPIGSFLRSMLGSQYLSDSGAKVYSTHLYEDYCKFIQGTCEPMNFEAFRKAYNNYKLDHYLIYQLAYFQGISVDALAKRPITETNTALEELYQELANDYGMSFENMCSIGDRIISKYRNLGKVSRKSGPKQREWAALDEKLLPQVKEVVDRIYNSEKPSRVSITRVEREIGAPSKQFQKLPKCTQYVTEHLETQNEYRARQVTWAVRLFLKEGRYLSLNKINHFLSYKKNDIRACFSLITDPEVKGVVLELLRGQSITREIMEP